MSQDEPKRSKQANEPSHSDESRLAGFGAGLAIGVILLFLLLTPVWAGLLAWGVYKLVMLVIS